MTESYPFAHHPCWSASRIDLWERIHLPIARKCNLHCAFCTTSSICHGSGPGTCDSPMTSDEALRVLRKELASRPNLRIVGISGPGEPLFNQETFEFLSEVRKTHKQLHICLSTNGVLLSDKSDFLSRMNVRSISISISAIKSETASKIYRHVVSEDMPSSGVRMGEEIIHRQLQGIMDVSRLGIPVKVNSVLIPNVNLEEMEELSEKIKEAGALMQNVIPLFPRGQMNEMRPPTANEMHQVRAVSSKYIMQFQHCKQCRSDVVGIPGQDSIISRSL